MKILVFGAGYVGLSNALTLAKRNEVKLIDINKDKIALLHAKKSPIQDPLVSTYLKKKDLSISFDHKLSDDTKNFDVAVIATPTSFKKEIKSFDTSSVNKVLSKLEQKNFLKLVAIRSTVPIGFTKQMQKKYPQFDIAFFPEFLRENNSLRDCLYPTRIICGSKSKNAKNFTKSLMESAIKKNINYIITDASEAEAIKLFSNSYLAMRISFFNELDSFAMNNNLSTKDIIDGVSMDPRIGNFYNNPSFGYGGYCLPKDTKQLKEDYKNIPQKLIQATIDSNKLRKKMIVNDIIKRKIKYVGVYRLLMKSGSDNWRESATLDILKGLKGKGIKIIIYEPLITKRNFMGFYIEKDLHKFKEFSKLIIANRFEENIKDMRDIIYTRDIFEEN